ncbi:hypothetical protein HNY42_11940 [Exiguobacterium sp. Helios]|uniref:hypothetical protein n=1 Tax=Exiguobacterium sp. Helios TaxID=2735868 RepID=UPI001038B8A2|nr:hypothetical protein [Exiguobacterium sp. Helios]QNR21617.1 hypothetical protein HNY42_11940 [Exiguobacterium sp. Helios]
MSNSLLYLYEDAENHRLTMSGVTFADFITSIDSKSALLVSGAAFKSIKYSSRTAFHYVEAHEVEQFVQSNDVERFPLNAIDIRSSHSLDILTDVEIAELLFLMHMKRGMPSPFMTSVENEWAYFSEHDGTQATAYLKDWPSIEQVLSTLVQQKIRRELRIPTLSPLTAEIIINLRQLLQKGILIDFTHTRQSMFTRQTTIPVYIAGRYEDMHVLKEDLETKKESIILRGELIHRKKNWSLELR